MSTEESPAKVAGGHLAERPNGGDRAGSRDDAGSSQPFSPEPPCSCVDPVPGCRCETCGLACFQPVDGSSEGPQTGDVPEPGLPRLRDNEWVRFSPSGVHLIDDVGNQASGSTLAEAQKSLDVARSGYASDPARKGS